MQQNEKLKGQGPGKEMQIMLDILQPAETRLGGPMIFIPSFEAEDITITINMEGSHQARLS